MFDATALSATAKKPQDPELPARKRIDRFGGRNRSYFMLGEYDGFAIVGSRQCLGGFRQGASPVQSGGRT